MRFRLPINPREPINFVIGATYLINYDSEYEQHWKYRGKAKLLNITGNSTLTVMPLERNGDRFWDRHCTTLCIGRNRVIRRVGS